MLYIVHRPSISFIFFHDFVPFDLLLLLLPLLLLLFFTAHRNFIISIRFVLTREQYTPRSSPRYNGTIFSVLIVSRFAEYNNVTTTTGHFILESSICRTPVAFLELMHKSNGGWEVENGEQINHKIT